MIFFIGPIFLLCLVGGFWLVYTGIELCIQANKTKSWAPFNGEIIRSETEKTRDADRQERYEAKIVYAYTFNGKTYHGNKIFFGYESDDNKLETEAMVEHFPVGKQVSVYINQAQPDESVLFPGIQRITLTRIWGGIGIAFFGLWFLGLWYLLGMPMFYKSVILH